MKSVRCTSPGRERRGAYSSRECLCRVARRSRRHHHLLVVVGDGGRQMDRRQGPGGGIYRWQLETLDLLDYLDPHSPRREVGLTGSP